jgi:hypothetical protein
MYWGNCSKTREKKRRTGKEKIDALWPDSSTLMRSTVFKTDPAREKNKKRVLLLRTWRCSYCHITWLKKIDCEYTCARGRLARMKDFSQEVIRHFGSISKRGVSSRFTKVMHTRLGDEGDCGASREGVLGILLVAQSLSFSPREPLI